MILMSFDLETTGLSVVEDRIIEFGAVLYSTGQHKCLDNQGMLVKTDKPITADITRITGIHPAAVERFGYPIEEVLPIMLGMIDQCDYIIGYNCRRFDYHVLSQTCQRAGEQLPQRTWIDLFYDLPYGVPTGKLSHTAADHGILNLFPHSALADAQTVLAIAAKYDAELLADRAKSPTVILRSLANRAQNDVVKQYKFRWQPTKKWWWKAVKEQDVDTVIKSVPFGVSIEKDVTFEEMDS